MEGQQLSVDLKKLTPLDSKRPKLFCWSLLRSCALKPQYHYHHHHHISIKARWRGVCPPPSPEVCSVTSFQPVSIMMLNSVYDCRLRWTVFVPLCRTQRQHNRIQVTSSTRCARTLAFSGQPDHHALVPESPPSRCGLASPLVPRQGEGDPGRVAQR